MLLFVSSLCVGVSASRWPQRRLRASVPSSDFWLKYLSREVPTAEDNTHQKDRTSYWHFFKELAGNGKFSGLDCHWSSWSDWTRCSALCGTGTQSRSRVVQTREELGGKKCAGVTRQQRGCNHVACDSLQRWETHVTEKRSATLREKYKLDHGKAQACMVHGVHCVSFIRRCKADREEPLPCAKCAASTLPSDCAPKELLDFCTEWGQDFHVCATYHKRDDRARILLHGDSPLFVKIGDVYHEPGGSCVNTLDRTHYGLVVGGDDIDTTKLGQYKVIYTCSLDQVGVHTVKPVTRTVVVIPRGTPNPTPAPSPPALTRSPTPKPAPTPIPTLAAAKKKKEKRSEGTCYSAGTHHMDGCANYKDRTTCIDWTSFLDRTLARCEWKITAAQFLANSAFEISAAPKLAAGVPAPKLPYSSAVANANAALGSTFQMRGTRSARNAKAQWQLAATARTRPFAAAFKEAEAFAADHAAVQRKTAPPTTFSAKSELEMMLGGGVKPCVDRGAAMRKSCKHYRGTDCVIARTSTTRRRDFGGDAFDNCKKTCGLCAPTPAVVPALRTPAPSRAPTPYRCEPEIVNSNWTQCSQRCGLTGVKHRWQFAVTADCKKSKKASTARCNERACGPDENPNWHESNPKVEQGRMRMRAKANKGPPSKHDHDHDRFHFHTASSGLLRNTAAATAVDWAGDDDDDDNIASVP